MKPGAEVVGVALAGGASRRMGRDKARLRLGAPSSKTLAEATIERLRAICADVVVADRGRRLVPATASVGDGSGAGPAAGILGAAAARPGRDLLVLACDLPRVPAALLRSLASTPGGDWVVPFWAGRYEPLCALYRPRALAALGAQIRGGAYAVHRLADAPGLAIHRFDEDALAAFGRPTELFHNLNTPADLTAFALRPQGADG